MHFIKCIVEWETVQLLIRMLGSNLIWVCTVLHISFFTKAGVKYFRTIIVLCIIVESILTQNGNANTSKWQKKQRLIPEDCKTDLLYKICMYITTRGISELFIPSYKYAFNKFWINMHR